ncbi:hypothetical protein SDC9_73582 [bioreactor metagenome]|uniref:Uncharacterized protein n=1 Tax=bioreactor metagenome TaxID=1076179 RepID=A0A644YFN8_9ZZZZ
MSGAVHVAGYGTVFAVTHTRQIVIGVIYIVGSHILGAGPGKGDVVGTAVAARVVVELIGDGEAFFLIFAKDTVYVDVCVAAAVGRNNRGIAAHGGCTEVLQVISVFAGGESGISIGISVLVISGNTLGFSAHHF